MRIGQRIKERRKELGLSAEDLAKRLGKSRATMFRYENGEIENMPLDILKPLAEALQTTPEYLMGWEQVQGTNRAIVQIISRLRKDEEFFKAVKTLDGLEPGKFAIVQQMLSVFEE